MCPTAICVHTSRWPEATQPQVLYMVGAGYVQTCKCCARLGAASGCSGCSLGLRASEGLCVHSSTASCRLASEVQHRGGAGPGHGGAGRVNTCNVAEHRTAAVPHAASGSPPTPGYVRTGRTVVSSLAPLVGASACASRSPPSLTCSAIRKVGVATRCSGRRRSGALLATCRFGCPLLSRGQRDGGVQLRLQRPKASAEIRPRLSHSGC